MQCLGWITQEEGDAEDLERDGEEEDGTPDSDECHIIPNNQVTTAFVMQTVMRDEERYHTKFLNAFITSFYLFVSQSIK